jgi:hypothetical protein
MDPIFWQERKEKKDFLLTYNAINIRCYMKMRQTNRVNFGVNFGEQPIQVLMGKKGVDYV